MNMFSDNHKSPSGERRSISILSISGRQSLTPSSTLGTPHSMAQSLSREVPEQDSPDYRNHPTHENYHDHMTLPRARGLFPTSALQSRVYLKIVDSQSWHYFIMTIMLVDYCVQLCAVSFSINKTLQRDFRDVSRYTTVGATTFYLVDIILRMVALKTAFLRSNSNVGDLCALLLALGLATARLMYATTEYEFYFALWYICTLSVRMLLKPRARVFSKKLHQFNRKHNNRRNDGRRASGADLKISLASVRLAMRRIPQLSSVAMDMMETDLVIICGRTSGDMTSSEFMKFLERALLYRPRNLTATDFLASLHSIEATSSISAYKTMDVVRSTMRHWSEQRLDLLFSILVVCVNATIIPLQSWLVGMVANDALVPMKEGDSALKQQAQTEALYRGVVGILLLIVPFVGANYGIGYFQSKMIAKATERMQHRLLRSILTQDTTFFATRSEGDLNNLFASDIARVNALWQSVFWNLLNPAVSVVFGYGFIMLRDPPTGVLAFTFTLILLSSGPQGRASRISKEFGSKNAYATAEFQNAIACQKLIRTYDIVPAFLTNFDRVIAKLKASAFAKDFWASFVQIYIESAMYIFVAVQVASLMLRTFRGDIKVGDFFAFVTMLTRISTPVTTLGGFMRVAIGNSSSLQRLDALIFRGHHDRDSNRAEQLKPSLPKLRKKIELRDIYFRYDLSNPEYTLNGLSATIPKGSYTCIVGPSGSGKTTLLYCLMQANELEGGTISLDGNDVHEFRKASFKAQTSVVFQDIMILNGTILENIRYGNLDATDVECMEAARLAECHFIGAMRDGFQTVIGQHAHTNLSGGQAQRICLARAICRKPSLLLLDEATSALDPETERSIVKTLERLSHKMDTTIISVTHRLPTTVNADLILVLNHGQVVETGHYKELKGRPNSLFSEMINEEETKTTERTISMSKTQFFTSNSFEQLEDGDDQLVQQFTRNLSSRVDRRSTLVSKPRLSGSRTQLEPRQSGSRTQYERYLSLENPRHSGNTHAGRMTSDDSLADSPISIVHDSTLFV